LVGNVQKVILSYHRIRFFETVSHINFNSVSVLKFFLVFWNTYELLLLLFVLKKGDQTRVALYFRKDCRVQNSDFSG